MQQWTVNEPWLETSCALGEGPFYEAATDRVRFVDIKSKRIYTASLSDGPGTLEFIQLDVSPSVTCDIQGVDPQEQFLVAVKHGLAVLDRRTGSYEIIANFSEPDGERVRSNDGAADPDGRFWVGTMTDFGHGSFQPEGSLVRFDGAGDGQPRTFLSSLTIPNSVGWSPDQMTMYFTHTTSGEVFAFDYYSSSRKDDEALTNKRLFYRHDGPGSPDGFRVDVEGNLWHAVYGGSRVVKIDPEGGVVGEVLLPTRNVTCVQFAGTQLIITTAADDEDAEGTAQSRANGGNVFRVDVGVRGLDLFDFKLDPSRT